MVCQQTHADAALLGPSRARGWDTHTACSPLLLVLASQVPNSSLNPPADLLSVTSVARSVAVDNETGRVDEPFDFRSTLATCRYSTVPAAAAGTLRLLVACARQTRSRARPCAHASFPCVRCAAWHRWLYGRPMSRAPVSREHVRSRG